MAAIGHLITEAALDAMKRRGWVERAREPLLDEGRVLVGLWHPHQTLGEGADRYYTAVEPFRGLALEPQPSQLSLLQTTLDPGDFAS
jgi:hypothetical protein